MHVRDLVELGAMIAAHGTLCVQHSKLLTRRHMEQYWLASRCRHDRWFQALQVYDHATPIGRQDHWPYVQSVIEEILASELLTRTWGAVGCSFDRQRGTSDFDPIVRSVLTGHLEARNRVLHVLVRGKGFSVEEGVRLNRLRRQTERWTDVLLGYLAREHNVDEFAFNPALSREFAADLRQEGRAPIDEPAWELTLASLRAAYHNNLSIPSPHGELNRRIAASVLACFQSDLFSSASTLKSHWTLRLSQITDETQGLLDDLLRTEDASAGRFTIHR